MRNRDAPRGERELPAAKSVSPLRLLSVGMPSVQNADSVQEAQPAETALGARGRVLAGLEYGCIVERGLVDDVYG
jgi:hypothetical protein